MKTKKSIMTNAAELHKLVELYHLEQYLFNVVSRRFRQDRTLTPYDFFAIVIWKSNRSKAEIRKGLARQRKSVKELMSEVSQAGTPRRKVEILLEVRGVGFAIASAILTVCYPRSFTVLDTRAWKTLKTVESELVKGLPSHYPRNFLEYLQYCRVCRKLANMTGLCLRDIDRALWVFDWDRDLRNFARGE